MKPQRRFNKEDLPFHLCWELRNQVVRQDVQAS